MTRLAPQELRTFFVTATTYFRKPLFRNERLAALFMDHLQTNRTHFLLHAFVLMPDHFHILFTPNEDVSLEKAVQFLKGGFSFRAKRELEYAGEIWQRSFNEHRVADAADYFKHVEYIRQNPKRAGFGENYPYLLREHLDPIPEWLCEPAPKGAS
jgi:putative transposase